MIIDFETQDQIKCGNCGETENLSVVEFVFGSQVHCDTCGQTVT